MDNDQIADRIQDLLADSTSLSKHTKVVKLQELVAFLRTIPIVPPQEDASTMTSLDSFCNAPTSCLDLMSQSENARRLKALDFIRVFLSTSKHEFCRHLIDDEHLCKRKTLAIYEMIQQFLHFACRSEQQAK